MRDAQPMNSAKNNNDTGALLSPMSQESQKSRHRFTTTNSASNLNGAPARIKKEKNNPRIEMLAMPRARHTGDMLSADSKSTGSA